MAVEFKQVRDGEWIRPIMEGYEMKCCVCGTVHKMDFRVDPVRGFMKPARLSNREGEKAMTARRHTSGKFATRGARPARTELTLADTSAAGTTAGAPAANAAFTAHAAMTNKPAAKATAGQLVASGAIK